MNTNSEDEDVSPRMKISSSTLYDESIDVADAEEVQSPSSNSGNVKDAFSLLENSSAPSSPHGNIHSFHHRKDEASTSTSTGMINRHVSRLSSSHRTTAQHGSDQSDNSEEDDDDDEEDEDDDEAQVVTVEGTYDRSEFEHLPVAADVKELFQNITRYTPQNIKLDYKLRPFIPDFIPAVGDIDAFLKIPRPDGKVDGVGLLVLDEPCANQSDPAVLHLQLRAVAKQTSAKAVVVKKVECAEKNSKSIDKWIKDISDLHSSKPPPTVHYSKPMPDIDSLMQEWPLELEQQLQDIGLPTADLDCSLTKYVDIICSFFDIPIFDSRVQSLHVLFSLYSAVKKDVNCTIPNSKSLQQI